MVQKYSKLYENAQNCKAFPTVPSPGVYDALIVLYGQLKTEHFDVKKIASRGYLVSRILSLVENTKYKRGRVYRPVHVSARSTVRLVLSDGIEVSSGQKETESTKKTSSQLPTRGDFFGDKGVPPPLSKKPLKFPLMVEKTFFFQKRRPPR